VIAAHLILMGGSPGFNGHAMASEDKLMLLRAGVACMG
jgi:hypothetical protein